MRSCPATSIPPELLVKIVKFCAAWDSKDPRWQEYPRPYNHVCRYWREVIAASPHLWANVMLLRNSEGPTLSEDARAERHALDVARICHYLENSQNVPISIFAQINDNVSQDNDKSHPVVQLLCQHHPRWKDACFFLPEPSLHDFLLQHDTWTFSELRNLRIVLESSTLPSCDIFSQAPKLTEVALCDMKFSTVNIPWSQLTELLLLRVSVELTQLQEVLYQCTSLHDLGVGGLMISDMTSSSSSAITLSSLDTLTLAQSNKDTDDSNLLSRLRLPSLTSLTFSGDFPFPHDVKAFFEGSGNPRITTLAFSHISFAHLPERHDVIFDLLALVPSVVSLGVRFSPTNDPEDGPGPRLLERLLQALKFSRATRLCPELSLLDLRNTPIASHTLDLVFRMIESRRTSLLQMSADGSLDDGDWDAHVPKILNTPIQHLHYLGIALAASAKVQDVFTAAQLQELAKLTEDIDLKLQDGPQGNSHQER